MSPNGTTIDPHIDGAISSNMKPAASIPRSLAGTTIDNDNDIRGVTIKSGMHPPVQRMNSSTIYNRSLLAVTSGRRPSSLQVDSELSINGHGGDGGSQAGVEIREREEVLERLRRDLDRLLQSPKVA